MQLSMRLNDDRERWIEHVKELTGESTNSGAIDVALQHYIADHRNKQQVADELPTDVLDDLHTPFLPIRRTTDVGHESE